MTLALALASLVVASSLHATPTVNATAAPALAQPTPCATQVYTNNFETSVGAEWSINRTEVTPANNRRFLGQFGNETTSLTLANLPPHTQVRVAFDVYVIRTWDGNGPANQFGPDIFDARVDNGSSLIRTTFTVHNYLRQAYPGDYPGGDNPPRAGSIENNNLGYNFAGIPFSSVYRIEKTVPHTGAGIRLNFSASGLEALDNESWGLDNVTVSVDCPPEPCVNRAYSANFESGAGSEWSTNRTDTTPNGARRYLGQFANETASLTLNNLPQHAQVTVSFDVYIIRSWDGNSTQWGPDIFDVRAENGPVVTRTTFALQPYPQAFPGEFPGGNNPTGAGAAETNTLGYNFFGAPMNAVFRVTKTIPHTGATLKLNFSGSGLEDVTNESWGLDNVTVSLDCAAPPPPCNPVVFSANFETSVAPEWSSNKTSITPLGSRRYLGQFSNDTVSLSLANLPQHTQVTVAFDVYIIRSWDGNSTQWGPDIFDVRAENGPVVTRTTFALQPLRQAWPGEFPGGDNVPGAGATETSTLGYIFDGRVMDAVFRVNRTISHTGGTLKLNFSASGLEILDNESWGLDNVSISVNCPAGITEAEVEPSNENTAWRSFRWPSPELLAVNRRRVHSK
jgi:hypothetical protein